MIIKTLIYLCYFWLSINPTPAGFPDIKRQFVDVYSKFLQNARLLSTKALHQLFSRASSICSDNDYGKYVTTLAIKFSLIDETH